MRFPTKLVKQSLTQGLRIVDKSATGAEGMAEKVVNTAAKAAVTAGSEVKNGTASVIKKGLTKENHSWSRKVLPNTAGPALGLGFMGVSGAAVLTDETFKGHNRAKLGRISYMDGPARMTSPQTTGIVNAARSLHNPQAFNEVMTQAMSGQRTSSFIDDYGATGELVFALHNGR